MTDDFAYQARMKRRREEHAEMFRGVIPAQPGWYVVQALLDDEAPEIWRTPIIAWQMLTHNGMSSLSPLSFEMIYEDEVNGLFIMSPDGRIYEPEDASYDDATDFLASMVRKRDEQRTESTAVIS